MIQSYQNETKDTPIEAVYYFPIDIGFQMTKIKMELSSMDDSKAEVRVVETKIQERRKA